MMKYMFFGMDPALDAVLGRQGDSGYILSLEQHMV